MAWAVTLVRSRYADRRNLRSDADADPQAWWQGAVLGPHPAVQALLTDPYPALGADTRRARI